MIALEWTSHIQESEIAFFNEQMIEDMNQENKIVSYLGNAIARDELSLVYQPQIDIKTEKIIGMEALLRWDSKELGSVSPGVFIPIAERNYLIIDIGTWVIESVCRDLEYLNSISEFVNKELRCAIIISAIQMGESGFVRKFLGIVDKYKIQKKQLEVEITEGILFKNEIKNVEMLDIFREQGITVAIDDFGTGYSSLSYLHLLPIDKIKIDRSFIKNYPEMDDGKLAKILVEISKTLNINVLTEGAEEKEQVDYLKEIGCNYIQGFYYSKPLKLEKFVQFVIEN
jgi:EAL domain-containing protein (putative c-di-GMP-specific phosphodiesterase class I)